MCCAQFVHNSGATDKRHPVSEAMIVESFSYFCTYSHLLPPPGHVPGVFTRILWYTNLWSEIETLPNDELPYHPLSPYRSRSTLSLGASHHAAVSIALPIILWLTTLSRDPYDHSSQAWERFRQKPSEMVSWILR
jgi:hypothetical protein